jgi:predicted nucleic acid-binding Zn ribbon protein
MDQGTACALCGTLIGPNRRKYCSKRCVQRAWALSHPRPYRDRSKPRWCDVCGKQFKGKRGSGRSKRCSPECSKIANQASARRLAAMRWPKIKSDPTYQAKIRIYRKAWAEANPEKLAAAIEKSKLIQAEKRKYKTRLKRETREPKHCFVCGNDFNSDQPFASTCSPICNRKHRVLKAMVWTRNNRERQRKNALRSAKRRYWSDPISGRMRSIEYWDKKYPTRKAGRIIRESYALLRTQTNTTGGDRPWRVL